MGHWVDVRTFGAGNRTVTIKWEKGVQYTAEALDKLQAAFPVAQKAVERAAQVKQAAPDYRALTEAEWKRFRWAASRMFNCRLKPTTASVMAADTGRLCPFTTDQRQTIQGKLQRLSDGLHGHGGVTVKVGFPGFHSQLCKLLCVGHMGGLVKDHGLKDLFKSDRGTTGHEALTGLTVVKGDIHIARWYVEDYEVAEIAQVLVHESAHKFADVTGSETYFNDEEGFRDMLDRRIGPSSCLRNADSYGWFSMVVGGYWENELHAGGRVGGYNQPFTS